MHTWTPTFSEFQAVFSNDYCLKILTLIHRQTQNGTQLCAADIAKLLEIHISTATKYLELLSQYNLVSKEQILDKPGKPTYYQTVTSPLALSLDLDQFGSFLEQNVEADALFNPSIRELPNLAPRIIYEFTAEGIISGFLIQIRTKARRIKTQRIILSPLEGALMKYLPHPTMAPKPFLAVCQNAGITDYYSQKTLLPFLEKLIKYQIIELDGT